LVQVLLLPIPTQHKKHLCLKPIVLRIFIKQGQEWIFGDILQGQMGVEAAS